MADDPDDLRKRAAHLRRLASIPTIGGQATDRRLIELALRLEEQAVLRMHKRRRRTATPAAQTETAAVTRAETT